MTDLGRCPSCALNPSVDDRCPRCGAARTDAAPSSPAGVSVGPTPLPPNPDEVFPLAARIAGGLIVANALVNAASGIVLAARNSQTESPATGVAPLVIGVLLGGSLLAGNRKYLKNLQWLVGIGGSCFLALRLYQGALSDAGVQFSLTSGFLLLLVGNAGRRRMLLGTSMVLATLALETVSLVVVHKADAASSPLEALKRGDILEVADHAVTGVKLPYTLRTPNENWFLRSQALVHKDNAIIDQWLVQPGKDLGVFVIAEEVAEDRTVPLDAYADAILAGARENYAEFVVKERRAFKGGLKIRAEARLARQEAALIYVLHTFPGGAVQLVANGPKVAMAANDAEMMAILSSLELPR